MKGREEEGGEVVGKVVEETGMEGGEKDGMGWRKRREKRESMQREEGECGVGARSVRSGEGKEFREYEGNA